MKKLFVAAAAAMMMTSCGMLYANYTDPVAATGNNVGNKVGTSSWSNILGIVQTGDAGINAAAKSAGIKKISHVDYESSNILGIYAKHTTIVYGE